MATTTARLGLSRPQRGDLAWDDDIQGWLDKLDTYGAFGDTTLTWTALQTFATMEATTSITTPLLSATASITTPLLNATTVSTNACVSTNATAGDIICTTFHVSAALPDDTTIYVLPTAEDATSGALGSAGDAITIYAQQGQASEHVAGVGGLGGQVTMQAGAGGTAVDGGNGGDLLLAGGDAGSGSSADGARGRVRLDGSVVYATGVMQFTDPWDATNPGPQTVNLTSDDTEITPTSSVILLSSNEPSTATNRTFFITTTGITEKGRILYLVWTDTDVGEIDTSKHKVSGAWPGSGPQYNTLTLISDGTDWLEISRSANS